MSRIGSCLERQFHFGKVLAHHIPHTRFHFLQESFIVSIKRTTNTLGFRAMFQISY